MRANTNAGKHIKRMRGTHPSQEIPRKPCIWKGRWRSLWALGEGKQVCSRLDSIGSAALQAYYLAAPVERFQKVKSFETRVKNRLVSTIDQKTAYHLGLPQKLSGTFGMYQGATEQQSKDCFLQCAEEFDRILDPNLQHAQSLRLLKPGSPERIMGMGWATSPPGTLSLMDSPMVFVPIQEAAAAPLDETPVEQLHSQAHVALNRPGAMMKPGAICAYVRHPEVVKTFAQPDFEWLFRSSWRQQLWDAFSSQSLGATRGCLTA